MAKNTKKELNELFARVCKVMGWSQETAVNRADGGYDWIIGAVQIDDNSTYGGRNVERISSNGGGTSRLTHRRLTPTEFRAWCEGMLCAAHEFEQRNKQ